MRAKKRNKEYRTGLSGRNPSILWRVLPIQRKLAIAITPPASMPRATFTEKKPNAAIVRTARSTRLRLVMTELRVSSLIVVITSFYLPAGNYVDVFKGSRDADHEKYIK